MSKPSNDRTIHSLKEIKLEYLENQLMEEDNGCLLYNRNLK
jgi:hypothetical protein